jgi:hypothetical protein
MDLGNWNVMTFEPKLGVVVSGNDIIILSVCWGADIR